MLQFHRLFLSTLVWIGSVGAIAQAADFPPPGYNTRIPNAEDRSKIGSSFVRFPNFPRLDVVLEGVGGPNPLQPELYTHIQDEYLKGLIRDGAFTTLEIRDLDINEMGVRVGDAVAIIPFAVSVKHRQDAVNEGTIEVFGEIRMGVKDVAIHSVQVIHFVDSWWLEQWERKWWSANRQVDLNFAKAVVEPVLKHYFSDDENARILLSLVRPAVRF